MACCEAASLCAQRSWEERSCCPSMLTLLRPEHGTLVTLLCCAPPPAPPIHAQIIVLEDRAEYMVSLPDGQAEQQQRVPFEPLVVVNPRIAPLSDAGARFFEGCLSVPGYQVRRPPAARMPRARAHGRAAAEPAHSMGRAEWRTPLPHHPPLLGPPSGLGGAVPVGGG